MPPDYISTTDVSGDETPKRTKEHLALQNATRRASPTDKTKHNSIQDQVVSSPAENILKPKSRESLTVNPMTEERLLKSKSSTGGETETMNRLNSRISTTAAASTINAGNKSPMHQQAKKDQPALNKSSTHRVSTTPSATTDKQKTAESRSQSKTKGATIEEEEKEPPYVIIKDGSSASDVSREKRGKIVTITDTRFVPQKVTIYVGECLNFQLADDIDRGQGLLQNKVEQVRQPLVTGDCL